MSVVGIIEFSVVPVSMSYGVEVRGSVLDKLLVCFGIYDYSLRMQPFTQKSNDLFKYSQSPSLQILPVT